MFTLFTKTTLGTYYEVEGQPNIVRYMGDTPIQGRSYLNSGRVGDTKLIHSFHIL